MPKEKKCSIGKQNETLKVKLKPLEGHHNYGEKLGIVKTQFFSVKKYYHYYKSQHIGWMIE